MPERGAFIAFEGGEASGKSTQAKELAGHLGAVQTREPGGTEIGEAIRAILLDPGNASLSHEAETLLMVAARAQHVHEVIRPALESGRHVVTDRYVGSSLAYQGIARGLGVEAVVDLSDFASGALWPDLTILLDVPFEVARQRRSLQTEDRLESAGEDFHRLVRDGFLALAKEYGWVVLDGTKAPEAITKEVMEIADQFMASRHGGTGPTA